MQTLDNNKISKFRSLVTATLASVQHAADPNEESDWNAARYVLKYIQNAAADVQVREGGCQAELLLK